MYCPHQYFVCVCACTCVCEREGGGGRECVYEDCLEYLQYAISVFLFSMSVDKTPSWTMHEVSILQVFVCGSYTTYNLCLWTLELLSWIKYKLALRTCVSVCMHNVKENFDHKHVCVCVYWMCLIYMHVHVWVCTWIITTSPPRQAVPKSVILYIYLVT